MKKDFKSVVEEVTQVYNESELLLIISNFQISGKKINEEERLYLRKYNLKWCPKCCKVKNILDFYKSNTIDGLDSKCKDCSALFRIANREKLKDNAKKYYNDNREEKIKVQSEYRKNNSKKIKESKTNSYLKHKEDILEKNKIYHDLNKEKIYLQQKEYRNNNKEKRYLANKSWRENNEEYIRDYMRNKYNNNPLFKLRFICRQLVRRAYLNINSDKELTTLKFLGYTPLELKVHIEKQFREGMTWDNHGEWHIDHIIPISQATTLEEGIKLSQLNNLQPLWANENLTKYIN